MRGDNEAGPEASSLYAVGRKQILLNLRKVEDRAEAGNEATSGQRLDVSAVFSANLPRFDRPLHGASAGYWLPANLVELVDTPALGAGAARCVGSSPTVGNHWELVKTKLCPCLSIQKNSFVGHSHPNIFSKNTAFQAGADGDFYSREWRLLWAIRKRQALCGKGISRLCA